MKVVLQGDDGTFEVQRVKRVTVNDDGTITVFHKKKVSKGKKSTYHADVVEVEEVDETDYDDLVN